MTYLGYGRALIWTGFAIACVAILFALVGVISRDRRWVDGARNALMAVGLAGAGAAACLSVGFFRGAYDLQYVFSYSERKLSDAKKLAGLWAGLDGSILFWASILALVGAVVAWSFRKKDVSPERRRLEPFVYVVYGFVEVFFFGIIAWTANPFEPLSPALVQDLTAQGLATGGMPGDGKGLNPLLDTYWMMIHPPSVYLGFILYTVPFAYGAAALLAGEFSSAWIKSTRGWIMAAWLLNTNGIILGGLWAYEVLGWGGYWAWDPVENASFLPWLGSTAFLHSVMVQERRGMLRTWNALLVCLTFLLSIFGTYLTRSGVVNSVHAFGENEALALWFLIFMLAVLGFTLFMVFFRMPQLRSDNTIDSLFSREAAFVMNNFVLLSLAAAITILVLWPKISLELWGRQVTVGVPAYNRVCTPLFVALFALTALGPALGWVKTSARHAVMNLLGPAAAAVPMALVTQWIAWDVVRGGAQGEVYEWSQHVWPTFIMLFLCWLIVLSLGWEVVRTAYRAGRASGRGFAGALSRMVVLQNRRYGGYVVHMGLAMLGVAVTISAMYRTQTEVELRTGDRAVVAEGSPYELRLDGVTIERARQGQAYDAVKMDLVLYRHGDEIARMNPEARYWPVTAYRRDQVPTTEVEIQRRLAEDFYVYYERPGEVNHLEPIPDETWWERQSFRFLVFRNPFMWLLWSGWITMIVGGAFAALPLGGRKVGLAG